MTTFIARADLATCVIILMMAARPGHPQRACTTSG